MRNAGLIEAGGESVDKMRSVGNAVFQTPSSFCQRRLNAVLSQAIADGVILSPEQILSQVPQEVR